MIDSILFAADIPAGSYAAGTTIPLNVIRGPSVVRDGYGTAVLKQVIVMSSYSAIIGGTYVKFKNSNWNDDLKTMLASVNGNQAQTFFSKVSPVIQKGGDTELQPNSSFEVNLVIPYAATTNDPTSVFCLIDIDYPSVSAVANPRDEKGLPVSIMREDTVTAVAHGDAANLIWTTINVDEFKAGYRYLLAQVGMTDNTNLLGFVAFSGAPSMNGLVRIIPVIPRMVAASRIELEYSTPLVKGPMNIEYAVMGTAGTCLEYLECDYIRR